MSPDLPFVDAPRWTSVQLEQDIAQSIESFRRERFEEPREVYSSCLEEYLGTYEELVELTVDLTQLRASATEIVGNPGLLHALRFLAGPFVSVDDLKTIAGTRLSARAFKVDAGAAQRVIDTVLDGLDRHRFPWISEGRHSTEEEKGAAALASAALMASEQTRTLRRNQAKMHQEGLVEQSLLDAGFRKVPPPRRIRTLEDAPGPGTFCGETLFGGRKADLVVGLWDQRRMPIECKVSNSGTNSYKRINNDAAVKAVAWLRAFGEEQVVPAAVLSGVFKRANLEDAQARGLTLLWAHRLDDMLAWISSTRAQA